MAILPEGSVNLSQGVTIQNWPTRTYYVNPDTKHITGMADGIMAMRQAVEIIVNVERFFWQIYGPNFGMQWNGLIGRNHDYAAVEAQRRLRDAFSVDERIIDMRDYAYKSEGDKLNISFTVGTVYGDIEQNLEVAM